MRASMRVPMTWPQPVTNQRQKKRITYIANRPMPR